MCLQPHKNESLSNTALLVCKDKCKCKKKKKENLILILPQFHSNVNSILVWNLTLWIGQILKKLLCLHYNESLHSMPSFQGQGLKDYKNIYAYTGVENTVLPFKNLLKTSNFLSIVILKK